MYFYIFFINTYFLKIQIMLLEQRYKIIPQYHNTKRTHSILQFIKIEQ